MSIAITAGIFIAAVAEVALGCYVFFENPSNNINRLTALRCGFGALLSFIAFLLALAPDAQAAELWSRAQSPLMLLLPALYLVFIYYWTQRDHDPRFRWIPWGVMGAAGVFGIVSLFTDIWGAPELSRLGVWAIPFTSLLTSALVADAFIFILLLTAIYLSSIQMAGTLTAPEQRRQGLVFFGILAPTLLILLVGVLPRMAFSDWPVLVPVFLVVGDWLTVTGVSRARLPGIETAFSSRGVINAISDALVLTGLAGEIREVNPAFTSLTGFTPKELQGRFLPAIFSDDATISSNDLQQTMEHGTLDAAERVLHNKEGLVRHVVRSAYALNDGRGRPQGVAVLFHDVTEVHLQKLSLEESERRFHSLFESLPVAIWERNFTDVKSAIERLRTQGIIDFPGYLEEHPHFIEECIQRTRVTSVNATAQKMIGANTREEAMTSLGATLHDEALVLYTQELTALWENRTEFEKDGVQYTMQNQHMDVHIRWTTTPGTTEVYDRVVTLITDITERMNIEREREQLFEEVNLLSTQDFLTNLYNRRHFVTLAQSELERAYRYNHSLSVVLLDVDGFKNINDQYGHSTGDQAMQQIAAVFKQTFRKVDVLCRYAGDEFVALLPEVSLEQAQKAAERLRKHVSETPLSTDAGKLWITASLGIASIDTSMPDLDTLLSRADQALQQGKAAGGNQLQSWKA